ncbi:MAG: helix-turn-helix transcriptional regulator [Sedimentisphaerales bacterium]
MNTEKKMSNLKPIISISEMCKILNLSRGRFYQLLKSGFFPKTLTDDRSKRPYYNQELQGKCIECRQTGIGVDGSYMLFYSSRKTETVSEMKSRKKKIDPALKELTDTLKTMGIETTVEQVQRSLSEIYPDGTEKVEQGVVIRELFRFLKSQM